MTPFYVELIGTVAAILGTISWLPQTLKTIRSKDTRSLSLATTLSLIIALILWIIYGALINSWPLVISNLIVVSMLMVLLIMKLKHG